MSATTNYSTLGVPMPGKGVPQEALDYLLDRGHTRQSIKAANFRWIDGDTAARLYPQTVRGHSGNFAGKPGLIDNGWCCAPVWAILLPFPDHDNYAVARIEYEISSEGKGDGPGKFQNPSGPTIPFIPSAVSKRDLLDPRKPLYFVEGSFKAAAAAAHGVLCIGVNGHTGVFEPKTERTKLRPELRPYMKPGRDVCLLLDADVRSNSDVCKSQLAFLDVAAKLNCKPVFIEIPDLGDGHTGIDDWLKAKGTLTKFEKLERHPRNSKTVIELRSTHTDGDGPTHYLIGPEAAKPTREELLGVPYQGPMVIEGYLPMAPSGFSGPGGWGKTTELLHESVHVILDRPLFGRKIERPGRVLMITKEDTRALTLGRLNDVCRALKLTTQEYSKIFDSFFIEDVTATHAKLVEADRYGPRPTRFVDEVIELYKDQNISMVLIDPTSMLGPGETSGNDGMSELNSTGWKITNALQAAVRFVHHVSQAVYRGGIIDQYTPRGGTAFTDNGRAGHQFFILKAREIDYEDDKYTIPADVTDTDLKAGNVIVIFVHKLSYRKRDKTPIVLVRSGFEYRYVPVTCESPQDILTRQEKARDTVLNFIIEQFNQGTKLTKDDLEKHTHQLGLTRLALREACSALLKMELVVMKNLPPSEMRTKRTRYLHPTAKPSNPANPANPAEQDGGITTTDNRAGEMQSRRRRLSNGGGEIRGEKPAPRKERANAQKESNPANPAVLTKRLNGAGVTHV